MKKLLTLVALAVGVSGALAQGTINFANFATGVNAPVTNAAGQRITLSSGTYLADLYWSANLSATADQLTAAGFNQVFSTLALSGGGYFLGSTKTITGGQGTLLCQVRVWNTQGGLYPTWSDALERGSSILFQINAVTPPTPANPMTALGNNGIQLTLVPEPSSFAIAGLGMASLLIFRRRK